MYCVFFSRIEQGMDLVKERLSEILPNNPKVAIFPWAFPTELNSYKLENEFFKHGERRYNRYINELQKLGICENDITVCNCYSDSTSKLKEIINSSNILLLPGGNPEMFFKKVVHDTEILYDIKHYSGLIIGESAGTELQLTRYFITAKNNFYKYFAFYDGFGVIDDPFYIDVHSINNKNYLNKLQKVSDTKQKNVYAIFDDGALVYNRENKKIELYGNVKTFKPRNNSYVIISFFNNRINW